jgi:hypothetical protein
LNLKLQTFSNFQTAQRQTFFSNGAAFKPFKQFNREGSNRSNRAASTFFKLSNGEAFNPFKLSTTTLSFTLHF